MHLENEGWQLCPVKATFRVQQLTVGVHVGGMECPHLRMCLFQEFRHLRQPSSVPSPVKRPSPRKQSLIGGDRRKTSTPQCEVSPFDSNYESLVEDDDEGVLAVKNGGDGEEEGFYSDDSDTSEEDGDISKELRKDFVDEETGEDQHRRGGDIK